MPDETDNLPAEQKDAMLAIRAEHLPDKEIFGSESITDNLPASIYESVGGLANTLSPEQIAKFEEGIPDDEVDIRPDDGMVYVSHEYIRRRMSDIFGYLSYTMLPATPLKSRTREGRTEWFQKYVLVINGVYVGQAMASRIFYENNLRISLDDIAEMIESNCLVRCAKKIGLALEPWNKRWRDEWRKKYAIQVTVRVKRGGGETTENQWRRKDADPLPGELTIAPKAQPVRRDAVKETPKAAEPSAEAVSPSAKPAPAAPGVRRGPTLNPAQVNLVFARARAAGLVVGDDASKLVELLVGAGVPQGNVKLIGMSELKTILPAIDAAKGTDTERI